MASSWQHELTVSSPPEFYIRTCSIRQAYSLRVRFGSFFRRIDRSSHVCIGKNDVRITQYWMSIGTPYGKIAMSLFYILPIPYSLPFRSPSAWMFGHKLSFHMPD